MQLANFEANGHMRVGFVIGGRVVDAERAGALLGVRFDAAIVEGDCSIRSVIDNLPSIEVSFKSFVRLKKDDPIREHCSIDLGSARLYAPVLNPQKIVCIGLNYRDHVKEVGLMAPSRPHAFSKLPSAITGPFSPIVFPENVAAQVDYEAELAVVVGRQMRDVSKETALANVLGYCVANDVSARDWQFAPDDQLTLGKGFDTFFPIGPFLTTVDEVGDPQALAIQCRVNGEIRQNGSTSEMVFGVAEILSYLSRICTLEPGDIVATGTPAGVAFGKSPDLFLKPGDVVECSVAKLGAIRNSVVRRGDAISYHNELHR